MTDYKKSAGNCEHNRKIMTDKARLTDEERDFLRGISGFLYTRGFVEWDTRMGAIIDRLTTPAPTAVAEAVDEEERGGDPTHNEISVARITKVIEDWANERPALRPWWQLSHRLSERLGIDDRSLRTPSTPAAETLNRVICRHGGCLATARPFSEYCDDHKLQAPSTPPMVTDKDVVG